MKADNPLKAMWKALPSRERNRRLRLLKGRRWLYPSALEYKYFLMLRKYLVSMVAKHMVNTLKMVPRADSDIDIPQSEPDFWTLIGLAFELLKFNSSQWVRYVEVATEGSQRAIVASVSNGGVNTTLGMEVDFGIGPAWENGDAVSRQAVEQWAKNQVTLIRNADADMLKKVTSRVSEGVRNGWDEGQIEELLLSDMPGITERRARLIARDQISKLESTLDRIRMQSVGWETYIWQTAEDERVRGNPDGKWRKSKYSHYVLNGKVCRWDDPNVCLEGGIWVPRPSDAELMHPGEAVQCRCIALPNWDEIGW